MKQVKNTNYALKICIKTKQEEKKRFDLKHLSNI